MTPCSEPSCDRTVYARGLCRIHYRRWLRTGDTAAPLRKREPKWPSDCLIEGCERSTYARGWCLKHYENNRLRGDPLAEGPGRGGLTRGQRKWEGKVCLVEGCERPAGRHGRGWCPMHYARWQRDGEVGPPGSLKGEYGKGYINQHGYRCIPSGDGKQLLEHRVVMEQVLGRPLRPGENVHHRNGQRSDNRPENLQLYVSAQPPRQHVVDLVDWARQIIDEYGAEAERERTQHKE